MKLVSSFLKHIAYPALAMTGHLRRHAGAGPAIVTYHGVMPEGYPGTDRLLDGSLVTPTALRGQLRLLQKNYHVISPQQFRDWYEGKRPLPPRAVLLTCDDGLQNTLTDMLPILQEHGVTCLFFVTGASIEDVFSMLWYEELYLMFLAAPKAFAFELLAQDLRIVVRVGEEKRSQWWKMVKQLSRYGRDARQGMLTVVRTQLGLADDWKSEYVEGTPQERRFRLLTANQVKELSRAEMTVGAHTLSHPILSQMAEEAAHAEISENRVVLERLLQQDIWAFAYPFGDPDSVTPRDAKLAEQSGFGCAFMNAGGGFGADIPRFAVPRVHVTSDMSLAEFEAHLSGFHRSLRRRWIRPQETMVITNQATEVGH